MNALPTSRRGAAAASPPQHHTSPQLSDGGAATHGAMAVWAWGRDAERQLGRGEQSDAPESLSPQRACSGAFVGAIVQIACGDAHCLARDELGNAYAWGRTREGQACVVSARPQPTPALLRPLEHESVTFVGCGAQSCLAIAASGAVYAWGARYTRADGGAHGALSGYGRGLSSELSGAHARIIARSMEEYLGGGEAEGARLATQRLALPTPTPLELPRGARPVALAAGFGFVVVALQDGGVLAAGLNDRFQCGVADRITRDTPTPVPSLSSVRCVALACGQSHSLALAHSGECFSWGLGSFGQLGHGHFHDEPRPRRIEALASLGAVYSIACGHHHSLTLLLPSAASPPPHPAASAPPAAPPAPALLLGFGHAEWAQLGTGDFAGRGSAESGHASPRRIPLPAALASPRRVACGGLHALLLDGAHAVWSFGWGAAGALGHADRLYCLQPTRVRALEGRRVVSLAGGARHSAAAEAAPPGGGGAASLAAALAALRARADGADIVLLAGAPPAARLDVHLPLLAARCPRLLAMACLHARFCRPYPHPLAAPPPRRLSLPPLWLRAVRPAVLALLVEWLYSDHFAAADALFEAELARLAARLRLPALAAACAARARAAAAPPSLAADLRALLERGDHADLRLLAAGGALDVSRALVCARSDYFRSCLEGRGFAEAARDAPTYDLRPWGVALDELRAICRFIYTGRVSPPADASDVQQIDPSLALRLIHLASAFLLEELKCVCEAVLLRVVDRGNAAELLRVAEDCFAPRLRYHCALLLAEQPHDDDEEAVASSTLPPAPFVLSHEEPFAAAPTPAVAPTQSSPLPASAPPPAAPLPTPSESARVLQPRSLHALHGICERLEGVAAGRSPPSVGSASSESHPPILLPAYGEILERVESVCERLEHVAQGRSYSSVRDV
ncbi:hypothetical protein AB1Y20_011310 [Prymnesium parvum]|uniref:BTB domain-containing protein n=1 Tax=Prymnesium parvum TaxID=97485 RepID=A0AB34INI0_PRYPA